MLIGVDGLLAAYGDVSPDPADPAQRVSFGTSGHRGTATAGTFIEAHVRAAHGPRADGIVITPSHNPPGEGGLKYNPPSGGPADTSVTRWMQDGANYVDCSSPFVMAGLIELRDRFDLAAERISAVLTEAPGNGAPIGGAKVVSEHGWFAARPSGTEDIYGLHAESLRGEEHRERILVEAQQVVDAALAAGEDT